MNLEELIKNRHSVRRYKNIPLKNADIDKIKEYIQEINQKELSLPI